MKRYLYPFALLSLASLFLLSCEKKREANVYINPELRLPISCMKLDKLALDNEFIDTFNKLYTFDRECKLRLTISHKKDIVCNSPHNIQLRSAGKFPKSFLKMELRDGMELVYRYYIDLSSNVDEYDIKEGFVRLKRDLIEGKKEN